MITELIITYRWDEFSHYQTTKPPHKFALPHDTLVELRNVYLINFLPLPITDQFHPPTYLAPLCKYQLLFTMFILRFKHFRWLTRRLPPPPILPLPTFILSVCELCELIITDEKISTYHKAPSKAHIDPHDTLVGFHNVYPIDFLLPQILTRDLLIPNLPTFHNVYSKILPLPLTDHQKPAPHLTPPTYLVPLCK